MRTTSTSICCRIFSHVSFSARQLLGGVLIPTLAFGAVLIALSAIGTPMVDWQGWRPATCMPALCFCETIRTAGIRQPSNAWSSLAFVFSAFLIVGHAGTIRSVPRFMARNAMERHWVYPSTLTLALVLVGLGSAFYHASLTFSGQFFDVFGMYLIASFILIYNIGRLRELPAVVAVMSYLVLNVVLGALLYEIPLLRRFLFALVLLTALALEIPIRRKLRPDMNSTLLWTAMAVLATGFAFWVLDITKSLCAPESVFQGHAVWHLAGAVSSWLLYFYYCSERR